jgi:hypothetical protein
MLVAPTVIEDAKAASGNERTNLQGEKDMGDQQQRDRNQDHDRRNQQQQEEERRRREGISKPQPSKEDQAE